MLSLDGEYGLAHTSVYERCLSIEVISNIL